MNSSHANSGPGRVTRTWGRSMMNVEDYRQHAADCVRQAQDEPTVEDRNMVLNVALAWLRLALQTEAMQDEETQDEAEPGVAAGDDEAAEYAERELAS